MPTPKPYCKNTTHIKAFVLGCDPTAFDGDGNRIEFETVFNIGGNDDRYFSGILKSLETVELSLDDIYVQNLVSDYQEKETSENPNWIDLAKTYIEERVEEFNRIDQEYSIPIIVTSEILYKALLNEGEKPLSAHDIYSGLNVPVGARKNAFERLLFPIYRHPDYNLDKWPEYANLIKVYLNNLHASKRTNELEYYTTIKQDVLRFPRKPRKCPQCGSTKIATIVYGMPAWNEKQQQHVRDGKIVLGGCCVGVDDPQWICNRCITEFYRQLPQKGFVKE